MHLPCDNTDEADFICTSRSSKTDIRGTRIESDFHGYIMPTIFRHKDWQFRFGCGTCYSATEESIAHEVFSRKARSAAGTVDVCLRYATPVVWRRLRWLYGIILWHHRLASLVSRATLAS